MSIWCSRPHIGYDDPDPDAAGGEVRSYATGWSNHYPTTDGTVERPAFIDTAHIAPWCVPHHEDAETTFTGQENGPWLRLSMSTADHNWHEPHTVTGTTHASVVMDEDAVRALVADLEAWLTEPKVRP